LQLVVKARSDLQLVQNYHEQGDGRLNKDQASKIDAKADKVIKKSAKN
jgi:hypothetical protein